MEKVYKKNITHMYYTEEGVIERASSELEIIQDHAGIVPVIESYISSLPEEFGDEWEDAMHRFTGFVVGIPFKSTLNLPFAYMYGIGDCAYKLRLPEDNQLHDYDICIVFEDNLPSNKIVIESYYGNNYFQEPEDKMSNGLVVLGISSLLFILTLYCVATGKSVLLCAVIAIFSFWLYYEIK